MSGELRTIKSIENDCEEWNEITGGDRNNQMEHFNAEFHPLLDNDDTPIIFLVPTPPLHCLLLGPGNLIWDGLEEVCQEIFVNL